MTDANGGMLELSSAPGVNTLSFEQVPAQMMFWHADFDLMRMHVQELVLV